MANQQFSLKFLCFFLSGVQKVQSRAVFQWSWVDRTGRMSAKASNWSTWVSEEGLDSPKSPGPATPFHRCVQTSTTTHSCLPVFIHTQIAHRFNRFFLSKLSAFNYWYFTEPHGLRVTKCKACTRHTGSFQCGRFRRKGEDSEGFGSTPNLVNVFSSKKLNCWGYAVWWAFPRGRKLKRGEFA